LNPEKCLSRFRSEPKSIFHQFYILLSICLTAYQQISQAINNFFRRQQKTKGKGAAQKAAIRLAVPSPQCVNPMRSLASGMSHLRLLRLAVRPRLQAQHQLRAVSSSRPAASNYHPIAMVPRLMCGLCDWLVEWLIVVWCGGCVQHRDTEDNKPDLYWDFTAENYERVRKAVDDGGIGFERR
jgi:hypothetical protein